MITQILLATTLVVLVQSAALTHDGGLGKATSYQNIEMEHFHAVPTYVKKEYMHLLDNPIPAGKSSSKVEIHHGDKHDHGYGVVQAHNSAHGSGGHEEGFVAHGGGHGLVNYGENLEGHGSSPELIEQAHEGYQVHDQAHELLQQQHPDQGGQEEAQQTYAEHGYSR